MGIKDLTKFLKDNAPESINFVSLGELQNKKVAIEHNGVIIPKVNFKKKNLKNNDKIEIVHFIGGG